MRVLADRIREAVRESAARFPPCRGDRPTDRNFSPDRVMPLHLTMFDFAQPPADVTRVSPTGSPTVPYSGATAASRAASKTGAIQAAGTLSVKQAAILEALGTAGPLTDQGLAERLRFPLSSVLSTRNSLRAVIVPEGYEVVTWPDGGHTRRTRWRLR